MISIVFSIGLLIAFSDWFIGLARSIKDNKNRKEKIKKFVYRYYPDVFDVIIKGKKVIIFLDKDCFFANKMVNDLEDIKGITLKLIKQELELNFGIKEVIIKDY